jgi:hypothetical protein
MYACVLCRSKNRSHVIYLAPATGDSKRLCINGPKLVFLVSQLSFCDSSNTEESIEERDDADMTE